MAPRVPAVDPTPSPSSSPLSAREQIEADAAKAAGQQQNGSTVSGSGAFPQVGSNGKPWLQGGSTVVNGRGTQDNDSTDRTPWRPPAGAWVPRPGGGGVNTTTLAGIAASSDRNSAAYNMTVPQSQLAGALGADEMEGGLFQLVAVGRGNNSSANGVFQALSAESARLNAQGQRVTPQDLAYQEALDKGWIKDGKVTVTTDGPGSRGPSGGGSGPSTSMSYSQLGEADLQDLANQIGMTMVGRGVTDDEMAKILKRVRAVEAKRPQITSSNGAGVSTTQQGVSNSDRQDVIENILAKNPQYGDYQKATTMMDWFGNALNARLQNA